jgi:hypothetical protein
MLGKISVFGENTIVASFLEDYFGFYHNHLPKVAFALLAFPMFASLIHGKTQFSKGDKRNRMFQSGPLGHICSGPRQMAWCDSTLWSTFAR